jgi:hypothetical protein
MLQYKIINAEDTLQVRKGVEHAKGLSLARSKLSMPSNGQLVLSSPMQHRSLLAIVVMNMRFLVAIVVMKLGFLGFCHVTGMSIL